MHARKHRGILTSVCCIDLTQALEATAANKAENPEPETSDAPADAEQVGV